MIDFVEISCVFVEINCVQVDKKSVLGEIGKGYKIAIETLNEGRIGIAAQMLGLAEGAYEAALPFLQNRLHSETVQNGITQMEAGSLQC